MGGPVSQKTLKESAQPFRTNGGLTWPHGTNGGLARPHRTNNGLVWP